MKDKDIRLLYEIYNSTNAFGIGIKKDYKKALMNAIKALERETLKRSMKETDND